MPPTSRSRPSRPADIAWVRTLPILFTLLALLPLPLAAQQEPTSRSEEAQSGEQTTATPIIGTASGGQPTHSRSGPDGREPAEGASDENEDPAAADPAAESAEVTDIAAGIATGGPVSVTLLHVPDVLPDNAWVEATPLASDAPARLWRIDELPGTGRSIDPILPQGPAAVCAGAPGLGVGCVQTFLYRGEAMLGSPPAEALRHEVRFGEGTPISGRYVRDGLPVVGARVAVVPAELPVVRGPAASAAEGAAAGDGVTTTNAVRVFDGASAEPIFGEGNARGSSRAFSRGISRPFTLPLWLAPPSKEGRAREPIRVVETDEDGIFTVPPLVGGLYFLEATLKTGFVHRSEPFGLPDAADVRAAFGPEGEVPTVWAELAWQLGDIDIALGLALEVTVSGPFGEAIEGAIVLARQGESADELQTFRTETDEEGRALLAGFDVDRPVRLDCLAAGHTRVSMSWDLVPVIADCVLEPFASVRGSVRGIGGDVPAGTTLVLRPGEEASESAELAPELRSTTDEEGRFHLRDLPPGSYALTVGAPGHEAWRSTFELGPGQHLDLAAITLIAGRPLTVRVVDADEGLPLPDARVHQIEPAGASHSVDSDGEVDIAAPAEVALLLEAESPEYVPTRVTVTVAQQEAREDVVIELAPAGWIRVVVGSEAQPCAGCRLQISGRNLPPGGLRLQTDGTGEVLSRAVAAGWYKVVLPETRHLGSVVVERPDAEARWAKVERGEITTVRFDLDRPSLRVVLDPRPQGRFFLVARSGIREQVAEPEPDGSYRLQRRTDEAVELFLRWWDPASKANAEVRQGHLPSGFSDSTYRLRVASARLIGRLTLPSTGFDARPAPGVRIRLRSLHGSPLGGIPGSPLQDPGGWIAELRSRADGSFEIPYVPPGVYIVMAGDRMLMPISLSSRQTYDMRTFQLLPSGF